MEEFDITSLKPRANICIIGENSRTLAKRIAAKQGADCTVYTSEPQHFVGYTQHDFTATTFHAQSAALMQKTLADATSHCVVLDNVIDKTRCTRELSMNGRFFHVSVVSNVTNLQNSHIFIGDIDVMFIFKLPEADLRDVHAKLFSKSMSFEELQSILETSSIVVDFCDKEFDQFRHGLYTFNM
jgi:hypothetical protein